MTTQAASHRAVDVSGTGSWYREFVPASAARFFGGISRILIGFVFLAILWVLNAVFVIIASIQASDGKFYRYPMTIRFIQ